MENISQNLINISAANLINICIDEIAQEEIKGRIFHCYTKEAVPFSNVVEMIKIAEDFYDDISFPQAATKVRTFSVNDVKQKKEKLLKVDTQQNIINYRGKTATFIVHVKFRQNTTWQGEVVWAENNSKKL